MLYFAENIDASFDRCAFCPFASCDLLIILLLVSKEFFVKFKVLRESLRNNLSQSNKAYDGLSI